MSIFLSWYHQAIYLCIPDDVSTIMYLYVYTYYVIYSGDTCICTSIHPYITYSNALRRLQSSSHLPANFSAEDTITSIASVLISSFMSVCWAYIICIRRDYDHLLMAWSCQVICTLAECTFYLQYALIICMIGWYLSSLRWVSPFPSRPSLVLSMLCTHQCTNIKEPE